MCEFPSNILAAYLIERIGRHNSLAVGMVRGGGGMAWEGGGGMHRVKCRVGWGVGKDKSLLQVKCVRRRACFCVFPFIFLRLQHRLLSFS